MSKFEFVYVTYIETTPEPEPLPFTDTWRSASIP
jgi:hypothetical protein